MLVVYYTSKDERWLIMRYWQTIRKWLWLLSLLPATVIVYSSTNTWLAIIMLASIAVLAYIYDKNEKRNIENNYNKNLDELKQNQISMLSHQRHDAMNDVQVLLGYIRLDKKDKCIEYVDKIKERTVTESVLAKLKDYQLIHYIHELKLSNYPVTLEIEYLTEHINWKSEFTRFMIAVIECYRKYTHEQSEAQLTVYLGIGEQIHLQFEFNGELLDDSTWKAEIENEAAQLVHTNRLILTIDEQDINSTFVA